MRRWRIHWVPTLLLLGVSACAGVDAQAQYGETGAADQRSEPDTSLARLDAALERSWARAGLVPSPLADDAEFLRRVSLDLIGRVPTHGEAERFLADEGSDKRARVVDELLDSEAFAQQWAQRWTARLLPGDRRARRVATDPLESYLSSVLGQNQGWDQVVIELLSGEGWLEDSPQLAYLGARALRGGTKQEALAELSSTTARVFLGARIECAQCHDHPYVSEFSREDFWAQTAYFGRTVVSLERDKDQAKKKDKTKKKKGEPPRVEVRERERGELRVALGEDDDPRKRAIPPRFLGAEESSVDPEQPRRAQLGAAIIDDPRFAEATVGWVWTQLLGRGIVEPWDELLGEGERPALLTLLAADFRASDHDMRELLRTIVLSQAYQRSSTWPGEAPKLGELAKAEAAFAHGSVRPLSAAQLFASLMTVTELDDVDDRAFRRTVRQRQRGALREYEFVFSDDEMGRADGFSGNVPQALLLLNGGLTNQGVIARPGSSLDRILSTSEDTDARLEQLWLTVYGRRARPRELSFGREAVAGGERASWEDLMFAMLYSSEFSSNH